MLCEPLRQDVLNENILVVEEEHLGGWRFSFCEPRACLREPSSRSRCVEASNHAAGSTEEHKRSRHQTPPISRAFAGCSPARLSYRSFGKF